MDDNLNNFITPDNVFTSYSQPKSIKDMLIHSKFQSNTTESSKDTINEGCISCGNCLLCKNYLVGTNKFSSYESPEVHKINENISCETSAVIYLIKDLKCKKSYVGSTMNSMRTRWGSYKSHIKTGYDGCELAQHFKENPEKHPINPGPPQSIYDNCLKEQLEVILIEHVDVSSFKTKAEKRAALEIAEGKWQTELRTMTRYGGLNKKDNRKISNKKSATYLNKS